MDENNNNQTPQTPQTPQNNEMEEVTIPVVKNVDSRLLVVVVVLILVIVGIVITMLGKTDGGESYPDVLPEVIPEAVAPIMEKAPSAVEILNVLPPDFPKDIPLEKDVIFSQNSVTDVGEGKMQSVISFNSNESMSKNYGTYKQYLTDSGWNISNTSEGEMGSSLYAYKLDQEMNVTFVPVSNGTETQSMVIISMIDSEQ